MAQKKQTSNHSPLSASPAVSSEKVTRKVDQEPIVCAALSSQDQRFLLRVVHFLMTIQSPVYAKRAHCEGYTAQEHQEGWRLCHEAAGANRPLEHGFAESSEATSANKGNPERRAYLQELDLFENTWFPRTRAIIRRVVPVAKRDLFVAAFFQNLEQQPLGPGVINSVATYLSRVEGLAQSRQPEAPKVLAVLCERGLTEAKIKRVKELLIQIETQSSVTTPPPAVSPEEIAQAQAAQVQALAALHDWFNDWATTLRTAFNARAQGRLGLVVLKRKAS